MPADLYGEGHIHETYAVGRPPRYTLQNVNTSVFHDVEAVMGNVAAVTEHMKEKAAREGEDASRAALSLVYTTDGRAYYTAEDGGVWRMYHFIDRVDVCEQVTAPSVLYHAARGFARFQKRLADFPAERLSEVIPHFHDTPVRFENLYRAVTADVCQRKSSVETEIAFAFAREADTHVVVDAMQSGEIPLRVTHNDTKLNNVLFDHETGEAVCIIDLDTVMPGSVLYDFGDALRFGGNAAAEDETDLSKVFFRLDCFEEFVRGFAAELRGVLTPREVALLPFSVRLMTLECGMRFLTDYLEGDVYFRIHRPSHNLDRCRTQFRLVADMEEKMQEMQRIVDKYFG